jgi:hypothetical protein
MTDGMNPLDILCNASDVAKWNNEGLPGDTLSIQNGAIIANCKRWALMIDPQLQGIKWIRNRHRQLIYPEIKSDGDDDEGAILAINMQHCCLPYGRLWKT